MQLLRHLTGRRCLSEALQARSEFYGPTLWSSTAGCPQRSEGTRVAGSSFFCFLFFDEAKKRKSPAVRQAASKSQYKNKREITH